MGGHCFAIAGGKGGVGKTTTVVNTAHELAALGHDTVVVEADLAMPNLGRVLGVDHRPTIHDVLAGSAGLEAAVDTGGEVAVVPEDPSLENYLAADPAALSRALARLRTAFDVLLVDTGAGVHHEAMVPCGAADGVVLVTTPDDTAVADTGRTVEMVEVVDGRLLGAVATRCDSETGRAVAEQLGVDLLAAVPDAPEAVGDEPVVERAPDTGVAAAYSSLAGALSVAAKATGSEEPTAPAEQVE